MLCRPSASANMYVSVVHYQSTASVHQHYGIMWSVCCSVWKNETMDVDLSLAILLLYSAKILICLREVNATKKDRRLGSIIFHTGTCFRNCSCLCIVAPTAQKWTVHIGTSAVIYSKAACMQHPGSHGIGSLACDAIGCNFFASLIFFLMCTIIW